MAIKKFYALSFRRITLAYFRKLNGDLVEEYIKNGNDYQGVLYCNLWEPENESVVGSWTLNKGNLSSKTYLLTVEYFED